MPVPHKDNLKQKAENDAAYKVGSLNLLSAFIEKNSGQTGLQKALTIANVLQTTLDLERLIEIYSDEIKSLIPHDGISFVNKAQDIAVKHGRNEKYKCSYHLVVAATSLGQMVLSRKHDFTADEKVMLEYLLCALVYPLRNAITLKHAMTSASKDPLTGVNNRAVLDSTLLRETELARRHNNKLSLVVLDIDHFKDVNDNYGHSTGDHVLRTFADIVSNSIRSTDILFRAGGEEFILLLSNTGAKGAALIAGRIRKKIAKADFSHGEIEIPITASLGIASFKEDDTCETLFDRADKAMYAAKHAGRNCVRTEKDLV